LAATIGLQELLLEAAITNGYVGHSFRSDPHTIMRMTPNQANAATAVLTTHNGWKYSFEVFSRDSAHLNVSDPALQERYARLTKIEDRNGNAITINHVFATNPAHQQQAYRTRPKGKK